MRALDRDLDAARPAPPRSPRSSSASRRPHATESLEAWTERELASEREHHRQWLARILAASGPMNTPGRPTGMLTALGAAPIEHSTPGPQAAPAETVAATAAAPAASPVRRRSRWPVVAVLGLAIAAAIGFAGLRTCDRAAVVAPGDAAVDAASAPADLDAPAPVPPIDAALADAAPADAAAVDARRRDEPTDARRSRDAAAASTPLDATPAAAVVVDAAPAGFGFLTFTPTPYALVSVDGDDLGASPIYKRRLRAGRHHVVLKKPVGGAVVLDTHVDLQPGQTITLP